MLYTHLCSKCNTIAAILTVLDWVRTDGLLGWWVGWFGVESLVFLLLYKFTGRFLFVSISQFNLFTFNTRTISERSLTQKKIQQNIHCKKWRYKKFGTQSHLFQVDTFWSNIQPHLTRTMVSKNRIDSCFSSSNLILLIWSSFDSAQNLKSSNSFKVQQINLIVCKNRIQRDFYNIFSGITPGSTEMILAVASVLVVDILSIFSTRVRVSLPGQKQSYLSLPLHLNYPNPKMIHKPVLIYFF